MADMNHDPIVQILQTRVPNLLGIYAFGSRITGTSGPDSPDGQSKFPHLWPVQIPPGKTGQIMATQG